MPSIRKKYMLQAIAKAREGVAKGQTPFGACIVKGNRVVSCAHNAVWKNTDITAHAEIQAIRQACRALGAIDLKGCTLYSTCEPCPMCFSACHWANITTLVYGCGIRQAKDAGFHELTISNRHMKRQGKSGIAIVSGFMKEENKALFAFWAEQGKARVY
jgi:tRNA(Arg) A34 adenosine deaminase TadA